MLEYVRFCFFTYYGIYDTIFEFLIVFYEHLIHKSRNILYISKNKFGKFFKYQILVFKHINSKIIKTCTN